MNFGYPSVNNNRTQLRFNNGRFCNLPKEYSKDTNKIILEKFFTKILSDSSSKDVITGVDPLGFTFLNLDFICYVGLVTNKKNRGKYNNLSKKYPLNKFDLEYLKKQIFFEYDLVNFKEYIPIEIVTQNLHEIRGLNSKIGGNIDNIMHINSDEEWEEKFDNQTENIKKIYVGSRLIKFILDNIKFYQPNFFKNLKIKDDRSFVVHRSVSKMIKIYRNDFKKGRADIEFTGRSSSAIKGEKEYFEILIKILIENALKYSEFPKKIGPKVEIYENKKTISIVVKSYGRLIPITERPYLFSKGFRSTVNQKTKEGTGMGLYNAQQLSIHYDSIISFECKEASQVESIDLAWNIFTLKINKTMPNTV
jgi:two-component system sensor histidine kinase ArlS